MSLAIVWSYFHSLRESYSDLARHFLVIAPNLTVYERLREDFSPPEGGPDIFRKDPLIPSEWSGDWNLSVVLQDEAGGATVGGTLYLTNIHRLYDPSRRPRRKDADTYDWMGPRVARAQALDTGAALRDRITSHQQVMVLNDEAHHVWDSGSAWNEALSTLNDTIKGRTGGGITAQLDFSATPKDRLGQYFKHIVCDTPLGEAVDGGIVKTPIIGKADRQLEEQPSDDAAYRFDRHLRLGYERWKVSRDEWKRSGKKALLFIMCEDTEAADQITRRLNTDDAFADLRGKTINLHTNLKGKLKRQGRGTDAPLVFIEDENEISDDDLQALRKLSRELDNNKSPYHCIVSVLMLREGWDVRNVTTIVPLRPLTAMANILPEQTLGRGLRRMTPYGQAAELVTVIEHSAFASLYQNELAREGLPIEIVEIEDVPSTTVSIYPDRERKDAALLELLLPSLSAGHRTVSRIEGLTIDDVRMEAEKYQKLPLGKRGDSAIDYEGRHLFTDEIVEKMKIHLPLLENGIGAVSYFVKQLEAVCRLKGAHGTLAPLVKVFLEEILFEQKTDLFDQALVSRLGDSDVAEHLRAVFLPLVRCRMTSGGERIPAAPPMAMSTWKPFQATHSERRQALSANKTLFNLVPCNRALEVAFTRFADRAPDVAAFAKNAGPQCLRIDYLASGGRLAFYAPDFFVRTVEGQYYLVETKGREDLDVPRKARAGAAWCQGASSDAVRWSYLYVPQSVFENFSEETVEGLARTCAPSLENLLRDEEYQEEMPLFAVNAAEERAPEAAGLVDPALLESLPARYRKAAEQAISLFRFFEHKEGMNYAPVFSALLGCMDEAARGLLLRSLQGDVPARADDQRIWFEPFLGSVSDRRLVAHYQKMAQNLKRSLVFGNGISPLGLLRSCLDYALNDTVRLGGVFEALSKRFKVTGGRELLGVVANVNDFRNTYVAHQEKELTEGRVAAEHLRIWIEALRKLGQRGGEETG